METNTLCRVKPAKKYINKHFEKENKEMKLTISKNHKQQKFEIPDDYRADELFADLQGIPETVSQDEIARRMSNSSMGLVCKSTGESISFKDYAHNSVTLAELGVTSDKIYDIVGSVEVDGKNG